MNRPPINQKLNRRQFLWMLGLSATAVASMPLLNRIRSLSADDNGLRVIIVGGGLAGLTAAYELQRLGHESVILEADHSHIGGRARTLRFGGELYGEAGAMRIPKDHDLTRHYAAEMGLDLRPFISFNPQAYYVARGQKVRVQDVEDLAPLYDLKAGEMGKVPGQFWNETIGALLRSLSDKEKEDLFNVEFQTETVRQLDRQALVDAWLDGGLSSEAIEYMAVVYGVEGFEQSALTENLREEETGVWRNGFDEIIGGTDLLPGALAKSLKNPPRMGCEVFRIEQDMDGVSAVYKHRGRIEREKGEFLLCTLPFSVLEHIDMQPSFSPGKRRAIRKLHYDSSAKTLAITRRRFWETDENIFGGGTLTDLFSGSTYYPSDNALGRDPDVSNGPGVLLASYSWGEQARRQAALSTRQRSKIVLDIVGTFHETLNEPGMVQRTATWSWDRHPWSAGAFAFFAPGQHTELYADIISPEGRVFIAGEHASLNHTWMQGAFESALRAVDEMLQLKIK